MYDPTVSRWPLDDDLGTDREFVVQDAASGVTSVAGRRAYDSGGHLKSETNANVDCILGFTGRQAHEVGLQNNLNRWYDAKVGRWLSEDPLGIEAGDANLERYVGNRVATSLDPTGLSTRSLADAERKFIYFIFMAIWGNSNGIAAKAPNIQARLNEITVNVDRNVMAHLGQGGLLAWYNLNWNNADGITLGKHIYVKSEPDMSKAEGWELLCHEALHSIEQDLLPNWFGTYLNDYATQKAKGSPDPYAAIPAEQRAYALGAAVLAILSKPDFRALINMLSSLSYADIDRIFRENNPADQVYRDLAAALRSAFFEALAELDKKYHKP